MTLLRINLSSSPPRPICASTLAASDPGLAAGHPTVTGVRHSFTVANLDPGAPVLCRLAVLEVDLSRRQLRTFAVDLLDRMGKIQPGAPVAIALSLLLDAFKPRLLFCFCLQGLRCQTLAQPAAGLCRWNGVVDRAATGLVVDVVRALVVFLGGRAFRTRKDGVRPWTTRGIASACHGQLCLNVNGAAPTA